MEKMDQTRTDCNLPRMGFPGETPLLPKSYLHFCRLFLADMPPVAFLTTFCVKKKLTLAVDTVHGSHHPCTMRGHLYEETGARCGGQVSSRGRVEKATRGHATKRAQQ
jgi:hypothetical protein